MPFTTLRRKTATAAKVAPKEIRKLWWQLRHAVPAGEARPVFIVGAQRSGTTMLGECLDASAQVRYYPEHDRRAFTEFELREGVWRGLVQRCRLPVVAFKPLTSSHACAAMLAEYPQGRVVWVLRHASDRARSAVTKFGDKNLQLLRALAAGERPDVWQTRGLQADDYALVRALDPGGFDAASAAALFWYLRNKLFLNQGLDRDGRALVLCYERLAAEPAMQMRRLCEHLALPFDPRMADQIHARSVRQDWPADTHGEVRRLCDGLYDRLQGMAP